LRVKALILAVIGDLDEGEEEDWAEPDTSVELEIREVDTYDAHPVVVGVTS